MSELDVVCNARKLVDMAWDMVRSTIELVGVDVVPFITSRLVSGVDIGSLMTVD